MLDRLNELGKLQINWDSYGALPVNPNALRIARLLAQALESGPPSIVARPDGDIVFSWSDETFEIVCSGRGFNLWIDDQDKQDAPA